MSSEAGPDAATQETPAVRAEPFAGRYQLRHPLGRGGSKAVYRAHDLRLGRDVALALVTAPSAEARARVVDEARLVARASATTRTSSPCTTQGSPVPSPTSSAG